MNKYKLLLLVGVFSFISGCTGGCNVQSKTVIDPFENVVVTFAGMDGSGEARLVSDGISYAGADEATQKMLDDIVYKFSPNKNLENGQTIKMKVVVNDDLYQWSYVKKTDTDFRESADTANSTKDFLRFLP